MYDLQVIPSDYASSGIPTRNQKTNISLPRLKSSLIVKGSKKSVTTENCENECHEAHAKKQLGGTSNFVILTLQGAQHLWRMHEPCITLNHS